MKLQRQRSLAGFSLLEVLCAILILGVGIVGLVQGLTTALASHKESELQTTAALLAAGRLEMIQADGYIFSGEDDGEFEENPAFRWRQTITETALEGLFDIAVVIEHSNNKQAIYELRTLLFDPPVALSDDVAGQENPRRPKEKDRR